MTQCAAARLAANSIGKKKTRIGFKANPARNAITQQHTNITATNTRR
jgi:hypothetical protein